jgi:Helix-turn-helix domain
LLIHFETRPSDSSLVDQVWRSRSERPGTFHSIAESRWEIVITRLFGRSLVIVRGPESKATLAQLPPEGEWVGIRFKLGTFMPSMRSADLRDRNDVTLPNATNQSFWLNGSAWEFPSFDNAETFVSQLARAGLIMTDPSVQNAIRGNLQNISTRTEQRRVLQVTGLTRGTICQIERARRATLSLRGGKSISNVVHEAGYYDQAHLTRSLRRFIGSTPSRIARGEIQLSLLYNK